MDKENAIKLFDQKQVRVHWDDDQEKWYFSVQDVVEILSESRDVKQYVKRMRSRDAELNANWGTICTPLPMLATDGKLRKIQAADTEGLLRIIQSIPSPKAEPFKRWLAKVGAERIEETEDPEKAFDRAMETYLKKGYSKEWVNQRLKSIEVRKELTDEWDSRGVKKGLEYAILTDEITKAWAGLNIKDYKKLKNLKKENLRDNMTNLELVLNMLAEVTTTEISKKKKPKTFTQNKKVAHEGGHVAGVARKEIEARTGEDVVISKNYLQEKNEKKLKE
ncbi:MAG: Bro-N domain-containing protein [Bacteroidetes bacterium]|nr:Bro-N domain-containing protein [Bacteroidota bacterium]MBL7103881.1 Bro-N domain-containing protein [Bacteroidales bacterium]